MRKIKKETYQCVCVCNDALNFASYNWNKLLFDDVVYLHAVMVFVMIIICSWSMEKNKTKKKEKEQKQKFQFFLNQSKIMGQKHLIHYSTANIVLVVNDINTDCAKVPFLGYRFSASNQLINLFSCSCYWGLLFRFKAITLKI